MSVNPLLDWNDLPPFDRLSSEHLAAGIAAALDEAEAALDALEASAPQTWDALAGPLERLLDPLERRWGVVGHLLSVRNSPAIREAHEAAQPRIVAFYNRLHQSRPLYEAALAIRERGGLDPTRRRLLEARIKDAELAGVGLSGEAQARYRELAAELAEATTRYANNVLDSRKAWSLRVTDPDSVRAMPGSWLRMAADQAAKAGDEGATAQDGPWLLTLDAPSWGPVLKHCRDREVREAVRRALYLVGAAEPWDNRPLVARTLALRAEMAGLLGYETYAELSMATKAAPSVEAVEELLDRLSEVAAPAAAAEFAEVVSLASVSGAPTLAAWDLLFWSERLRELEFGLEEEALKPYFPLENVLSALFTVCLRLFGVRVEPADGQAPTWHPDVRFFHLIDDYSGERVASFFLDPYVRPGEKSGGAWMGYFASGSRALASPGEERRRPVAYMICNQSPPVGDQPSLMTPREVETLFHEFGHALHLMLADKAEGLAGGISGVEWDTVELPSQFMEPWIFAPEILRQMARHYQTGARLPEATARQLQAARNFQAGIGMMRSLAYTRSDLELHHRLAEGEDPELALHRVFAQLRPIPLLPEDRLTCSFGHLFAGDAYAAGYYSYLWSEVLSEDAFAAFEEIGLDNWKALGLLGRRYRDLILSPGGGRDLMEAFEEFRGRPPTPDALLLRKGLLS